MTKEPTKIAARHVPDESSQWVRDMHAHVDRTGHYRARDLERVLGDPRKSVAISSTGGFAAANHTDPNKPD